MRSIRLLFLTVLIGWLSVDTHAQVPFGKPRTATPGDIQLGIRRLNVLGSVLYIAAHPDDENTLFLTYLHNERNLRTAYLSLTRGDGGQNLIGAEQGEYVGVIRTQELLAARRIDGPEQLFSRAYDFGFSKSTDEAVKIWGRDQVLSDIVYLIRKFQPDVIVTRFPPDSRAGHGHHSASGYLAEEAFKLSNDPKAYPEQLKLVKPWQARRLFWNAFIPGQFMSNNRPSETGTVIGVETGLYNPLLGKSYGEIAAESRSQHKSQGFGVAANRGAKIDYLLLKEGDKPQADLVEGIDMSWNRVPNSERIQEQVYKLSSQFNPAQPAASVPALVALHREISQLDTTQVYVRTKRVEIETLIQQCLGLVFEALPADFAATPGGQMEVRLNAINRLNAPVKLVRVRLPQAGRDTTMNVVMKANEQISFTLPATLPATLKYTQPYWLEKPQQKGLFTVTDQRMIGLPENPPQLTADFVVEIDGSTFTYTRPWLYKYTDPVEGELFRSFEIRPDVTVNLTERVYAFADNTAKTVDVVVKANRASVKGSVSLEVPQGWRVSPSSEPFTLNEKLQEQRVTFTLTPQNSNAASGKLKAVATVGGGRFTTGIRTVSYPHIPPQTLFPSAEATVERLNVTVKAKQVGYIAGAGDEVPAALRQMGCTVTLLDEVELGKDLSRFDAIVVGIRAYNTEDRLKYSQEKLLDYVKKGGTMVVQYVTPGNAILQSGLKVSQIGPFPFAVSRDRVAEEDAVVTVLNPSQFLLNKPNKITDEDFKGWVQERGIYFAQDYGQAYESLFSMNDTGEAPKLGSLIYTAYGKGHFIYTGLAFFRQLPNGVPGAYRLFANLISAGSK
ncbi:PIG-L family deacetylase [uncultured Fibrella sp.]|uniref:PIG-L family deacetylase n=1 Tax=uncultured Fibrella sp. TaxID=1284596 RepID=UPI0035C9F39D